MTVGMIGPDGDALVRVHVVAPSSAEEYEVEAILDTGFNGFLALPADRIERIGLEPTGQVPFTTASGATYFSSTYEAAVLFGGRARDVEIVEAAEPLVGVELLWNRKVCLTYREGGRITLEEV